MININKQKLEILIQKGKTLQQASKDADKAMWEMKEQGRITDYVIMVGTKYDEDELMSTGHVCTSINGMNSMMASAICMMAEESGKSVEDILTRLSYAAVKCMKRIKDDKKHQDDLEQLTEMVKQ